MRRDSERDRRPIADVKAAVVRKRDKNDDFRETVDWRSLSTPGQWTSRTTLHTIVSGRTIVIVFGARRFVDVPRCRGARLYRGGITTTSSITQHETTSRQRPLLITVTQAAEMLSLSRSSIYQLIWTEQLVPIRIARSVRFSVEQLEHFVADRSEVR